MPDAADDRPLLDRTEQGVLWPDDRSGPYFAVAHWADVDGRTECVGLEIWKGVEPDQERRSVKPINNLATGGLGGTELRSLRLPALLSALWRVQQEAENLDWKDQTLPALQGRIVDLTRGLEEAGDPEAMASLVAERVDALNDFTMSLPKLHFEGAAKRQKKDDPTHLAQVALVYQQARRDPLPRPTKAVAETFHVSHSAATKWVAQARKLGLLPTTTPGRPSPLTEESANPKEGKRTR